MNESSVLAEDESADLLIFRKCQLRSGGAAEELLFTIVDPLPIIPPLCGPWISCCCCCEEIRALFPLFAPAVEFEAVGE